jgi:chromosome partitioning protein
MHVISFVTQKGGSGKTTLAFCCAVAAQEQGARVLVLDMDPQGTAEAWYQDREAETPRLAKVDSGSLAKALEAAKTQNFDVVLLDTPGRDEPAVAAAIRASDFCLIPCRPTPGDMKATPPTMATIKRLGKQGAFVLTQTPPRGVRLMEAEVTLVANLLHHSFTHGGYYLRAGVNPVSMAFCSQYREGHFTHF